MVFRKKIPYVVLHAGHGAVRPTNKGFLLSVKLIEMLLIGNKTLEELIKNRACVLRNKYPCYILYLALFIILYTNFVNSIKHKGQQWVLRNRMSHISGIDRYHIHRHIEYNSQ